MQGYGYPQQGYPQQQGYPPQQGYPQQGFPQQGGYPPQGIFPGASISLRNIGTRRFVCCEPSHQMVVNRDQIGDWEKFRCEPGVRPGSIALRSHHGQFVCAEPNGFVVGNRPAIGEWESFNFEPCGPPGQYFVRNHHGRLLHANPMNPDLRSGDTNADNALEAWEVVIHGQGFGGQQQGFQQQGFQQGGFPQQQGYGGGAPSLNPGQRIRLRSRANNKFLCAETNDHVVCNRDTPAEWETFHVEPGRFPGSISLRSHHGRFLCIEPNGLVIANRPQVGEWETFRVEPFQGQFGLVVLRSHHNSFLSVQPNHEVYAIPQPGSFNEAFEVMYA